MKVFNFWINTEYIQSLCVIIENNKSYFEHKYNMSK